VIQVNHVAMNKTETALKSKKNKNKKKGNPTRRRNKKKKIKSNHKLEIELVQKSTHAMDRKLWAKWFSSFHNLVERWIIGNCILT
jgi:hypothetical protein